MKKSSIFRLVAMLAVVSLLAVSVLGACAPKEEVLAEQVSPTPEVIVIPSMVVTGETFDVAGSGFPPDELLTVMIVGATPIENIYLGSGFHPNETGAFLAPCVAKSEYKKLVGAGKPALLLSKIEPGAYTLEVSSSGGGIATTPLVVKEGTKD